MTIGKLRRVPLRAVWNHEAYDFTTWLEENTDVLNEVLGWRGVGQCDGNDVGSNSAPGASQPVLNLYCPVVDEAAGVSAVRRAARDLGIEQPYRVGVRAPGEHTDYQLAWSPTRRDKSFSL